MNILYNTGGEFMISFHCQKLLSEYSAQLQKITENAISETLSEIDNISTFIEESPSIQLSETDFLFYTKRLSRLLNDDKRLLNFFIAFNTSIKNLSDYFQD